MSQLIISTSSPPVVLHVTQSWGGGIERWVNDFCHTDTSNTNIILKSIGIWGIPGQKIALYQHIDDEKPIKTWELKVSIFSTSVHNIDYYFALEEIISEYNITAIIISSLIGHSLDILNTGIKTIIIGHDYYTFCPAINIYFEKVCHECKLSHLQNCLAINPYNRFFPAISASEWLVIRKTFIKLILDYQIKFIAPSLSVKTNLTILDIAFKNIDFVIIPHGIETKKFKSYPTIIYQKAVNQEKLKIVLLGRLTIQKGLKLLQESYQEVLKYADILLLGCGDNGKLFAGIKGIKVVAYNYSVNDLPQYINDISPDLGLLLSILPETFSYTLSELMVLGIPTLATKLGSFENRIVDNVNGFLVVPEKNALIGKIKYLSENRYKILEVAQYISQISHPGLEEMVACYQKEITSDINEKSTKTVNNLIENNQIQLVQTQFKIQNIQLSKNLNKMMFNSMTYKQKVKIFVKNKMQFFNYLKENYFTTWKILKTIATKLKLIE